MHDPTNALFEERHVDRWKYFTIGHKNHLLCNPTSEAKVDELIELLDLSDDAHVLDMACGKGEILRRIVQRWSCRGVGVEISAEWSAEARSKIVAANLADSVKIVQEDGANYVGTRESLDAALCIGASWIWGGFAGTLEALARWTRPQGTVVVGEPFWIGEPSQEYLKTAGHERSNFGTHAENVRIGTEHGLHLLHALVSTHEEWDHYEGYQWYAMEKYAQEHPDDPDVGELLSQMRKYRDIYLEWGRDEMGWAIYLFLKP